jgi:hypothetical protein
MQIPPPSDQTLDILSTVSSISLSLAALIILAMLVYSAHLLFRTTLRGRIEVFIGVLLFSIFFAWSLFMGGYLEVTLGPLGNLLEVIVWTLSAAFFMFGHLRMLRQFNNAVTNHKTMHKL